MARKRKELFEEMEFSDAKYAKLVMDECNGKLTRNTVGIVCSLFVPIIDILAVNYLTDYFVYVMIALALIVYIIGGGLGAALKSLFAITSIAWCIIPFFPIDLAVAAIAFCLFGGMLLVLPIVFVLINRHQINLDKKTAKRYLASMKPTTNK